MPTRPSCMSGHREMRTSQVKEIWTLDGHDTGGRHDTWGADETRIWFNSGEHCGFWFGHVGSASIF